MRAITKSSWLLRLTLHCLLAAWLPEENGGQHIIRQIQSILSGAPTKKSSQSLNRGDKRRMLIDVEAVAVLDDDAQLPQEGRLQRGDSKSFVYLLCIVTRS